MAKLFHFNLVTLGVELHIRVVAMLRIEIQVDGTSKLLRLVGDLRAEEIGELLTHLSPADSVVTLDLVDLKIVDLSAVQFLIECELRGVQILACPPYVREWMNREGARKEPG